MAIDAVVNEQGTIPVTLTGGTVPVAGSAVLTRRNDNQTRMSILCQSQK